MNNTETKQHVEHLRAAIALAQQARDNGNHPFGALLTDEAGEVLLQAENTVETASDCTGHAETNLVRMASAQYERDFLGRCTLYTSTEPCAMCSGAIYWANIGQVVYALSENGLFDLTARNPQNDGLHLPCREVFSRGQHRVTIIGPLIEEEARRVHEGFWE